MDWHLSLAEAFPIIGSGNENAGWWEYRISYRSDSVEEPFFMTFVLRPNPEGITVQDRIKQEFRERKDSPSLTKT
jgi:hypothetical protein